MMENKTYSVEDILAEYDAVNVPVAEAENNSQKAKAFKEKTVANAGIYTPMAVKGSVGNKPDKAIAILEYVAAGLEKVGAKLATVNAAKLAYKLATPISIGVSTIIGYGIGYLLNSILGALFGWNVGLLPIAAAVYYGWRKVKKLWKANK